MGREERMLDTLKRRQPDLIPFLDDVYSSQNLSAIIRSSDSVGALTLYYSTKDNNSKKIHKTITQGSHKWLIQKRVNYQDRVDFLKERQKKGYQVVATHLDNSTISFREVDYKKPTIIVVGNEVEGVSKEVIEVADIKIKIPMMGMAQSLNVSVATAIILYEAERQRELAKMYETPRLSKEEIEEIMEIWRFRDKISNRSRGKIKLPQKIWLNW
jgi:tRNA (guanosine-2'-O-)-methyltransferase